MSSHATGPVSSASARTRDAHGRFNGSYNQWRSPLPKPGRAACRKITDAEVLERVAAAIGLELEPELDGRRLRRLNSALNRYALERRALGDSGNAERYTSRLQVAIALYGPRVELDDVKRQMRRVEADLAAAGLLEVAALQGAAGEDRGLRVRLLDPEAAASAAALPPELPGLSAQAHLTRRSETKRERLERRTAPYRRQQSDRKPRGGVPGLYVRRRDVHPPERPSTRNCPPWEPRPGVYGTTSLPQAFGSNSEKDASAPERAAGVGATPGAGAGTSGLSDATGAPPPSAAASSTSASSSSPPPAPASPPRSRPADRSKTADATGERTKLRSRFAALSRLRQIALMGSGPERLLEQARAGAPVCAIGVAAFEACFVVETSPHLWSGVGDPDEALRSDWRSGPSQAELEHDVWGLPRRDAYRTLTDRWATRLEVACAQIDRLEGPHTGIATLLDDVYGWRPDHGAPSGAPYDQRDTTGGDVTRHQRDLGAPVALAFFVRRLQVIARSLRRQRDPRRRQRSRDWRNDQELGLLRPWGALGNLPAQGAYLDELDAAARPPDDE